MKELNVLIFSLLLVGEVSAQVGLGTTTPSNDLDVESSSATATAIDINCTGAGDPKINFQLSGTSTFSMGIDNSDADKFKIGTSALETNTRLTIDASGYVGIGTTSPHAPLQFDNAALNRKIVLYEASDNDHQFLGFGVNNTILRYQLPATTNNHVFYAGTSSTASNELMRITGTGNVGIGTSSPTANLDVDGSAIFNESGAAKNFRVESDNNTAMLYVNGTNDRVGIGTTAPTDKLDVKGGSLMVETGYGIKSYNGVGPGVTSYMTLAPFNVDFYCWGGAISNSQGFRFYGVDALEFQIGNDGVYSRQKMAIGTTSLAYTLTVNGQPGANGYTAFTNYSDSRLKTNISSLDTGALSKILQLRPVSFQYNQKYLQLYPNSDLQKVHKGFIAQEIRQVFPEMVSEMKTSPDSVQYLDLDVSHLQVYLVKALQEQQAIINAQKAEIDALKQNALKVAALENKMNAMLLLLNNKQELTVKQ